MNGTLDITGTVADTLRHNWWLLALRGLAAVVFGVLAFIWPGATLITLVWLFGAFALVNEVLSLAVAAKGSKRLPSVRQLNSWWIAWHPRGAARLRHARHHCHRATHFDRLLGHGDRDFRDRRRDQTAQANHQ